MGVVLLAACGGGDSTTTILSGPGVTGLTGPAVTLGAFAQADNNMQVVVDAGPVPFNRPANVLYTSVKVCEPANPAHCIVVPHVQVDTGSVGLRILASKLTDLNLPNVSPSAGTGTLWQCYPFVIGGLWGHNVVANVVLGTQSALRVPMQLIQDGDGPASTNDCNRASGGTGSGGVYKDNAVLKDAASLGSNGILGIGATTLDCDSYCVYGPSTYPSGLGATGYDLLGFVMYYDCPATATTSAGCVPSAAAANEQGYNPVAALPRHNNGVILALPSPQTFSGAVSLTGELIFGLDTSSADPNAVNNMVPGFPVKKVALGTNSASGAYLNVTTNYKGTNTSSSYLDTGTNGIFFTDSVPQCSGSTWYCPFSSQSLSAIISDGDAPSQNPVTVPFQIDNAEVLFGTNNFAFAGLGGAPPSSASAPVASTFAWGMPFFYGKRTYLSIWRPPGTGPWYAWKSPP